jgi:threonine dehydrogenase-like Zn-dependent dehydrogenase
MLARAMGVGQVVGTDVSAERLDLATALELVDVAVPADEHAAARVEDLSAGRGYTATLDASGNATARLLALSSTAAWGRCAFVGEGGDVGFDVSQTMIHKQVTLYGSWVTSVGHMADLIGHLDRWQVHPERIVTDTFGLDRADEAYRLADAGTAGKVVITFP